MRRRARDDAGVTLAETLVVMMLMGVVGALVLSFALLVQSKVSSSQVMNENTNQASAATNEITRLLRGAVTLKVRAQPDSPAFVEADATSMTFYTVVDTDPMTTPPMLVRLEVTATGDLVEKRWLVNPTSSDPFWTFPATTQTPSSSRVVARGMMATPGSGKALFTYLSYDADGNEVPVAGTGALTKQQRAAVGAVRVDAEAQTGTRARSTLVTTLVGLRNLPAGSHGAH
ncbi:MAG: hypothetical protein FWH11_09430 [Micrococcales bacterium]|nr:hypothetical protein [Micrococcales bacterium]